MGHRHDEAEEEQVPFRLEGASGAGRHIAVTAAKRRWLDEHLHRQWRRPPTAAESDRFVADFVREEVLYREALALGLDRDDLVVRRRLVHKMEMLALRDAPGVTEPDLIDYYLAHRADYTLPSRCRSGMCFSARLFAALTRARRPWPRWARCGIAERPGPAGWVIRRRRRLRSATGPGPWWRPGSGRASPRRSSRPSRADGRVRWPRPTATTWCS